MEKPEFWEFSETLAGNLDPGRIMRDVEKFSRLKRYTGSKDGERAVDLIAARMEELDIPVVRETCRIYRSLPKLASVRVTDCSGRGGNDQEISYPLTPYVYSGAASGLEAELVYDRMGEEECTQSEMESRCADWRGKVVLTYEANFEFACQAHRAGAAGVLTIWPENLAHHGTLGGVWGTPEPDDLENRYPYLPFAEIVHKDGEELKRLCLEGPVWIQLDIAMDNRIVTSSMPVATIHGREENFVLVSGHYDSWYEGVTDNGVANAAMMEMARVLKEYQPQLKRTVVLAWWSGHSDGRYSGSTWYCDRYYQELKEHCVAHINMDICGCKGSDLVGFNTSMLEGKKFNDCFLSEFNDGAPPPPVPMARFADQTFWGADVPFAIMPKFSKKLKDGRAAFYWWHTVEDTLDKVDSLVALRDAQVILMLAGIFANTPSLPAKFVEYTKWMRRWLEEIEKNLSSDFDLSPVFPQLDQLEAVFMKLERELEAREDTDEIVMRAAGELTRLVFTAGSPYHQDPAVDQGLFPGIGTAAWLTPENTREDYYLAAQTRFVRQRNRLVCQMRQIMELCDYQMMRWNVERDE